MHKEEAIQLCKKHINRYVLIHTADGMAYDGIVENVDDENVYLAVPAGDAGPAGTGAEYAGPMGINAEYAAPMGANINAAFPAGANVNAMAPLGAHVNDPNAMTGYRPDGFGYGFGYPGYGFGYPGFGFGSPFYGYPSFGHPYGFFGPRRRFSRLVLPLAALTALSLLPYY